MTRIYLDNAATTPVRPEVVEAMLPYFTSVGYNPSSLHAEGQAARAALDAARERVAALLGAHPKEIVFTGGGSEADTLAIHGAARAAARAGRRGRLVTSAIEHHAVLHALDALEREGFEALRLPVDGEGFVDPEAFARAVESPTTLASIMLANNEIGTVEPVAGLAAAARERGAVFHTDAVQAAGQVALDVRTLGVDLLSISAHKFNGPKGVGALFVRRGLPLDPIVYGGGQEHGARAGTENVAGIVGLARALELAVGDLAERAARTAALRDRLARGILAIPDTRLLGPPGGEGRLPNNLSVAFAGVSGEALLIRLDLEGVAVSTGSACASGIPEPSHVVWAIGLEPGYAGGVVRFSLGRETSSEEVDRVAALVAGVVEEMRAGERASTGGR
ncbi:MAG TPA: aminotransferase class V-fold PLP-dependent enzyme [Candidatus Dormibacteraeota bacterium]|nr:aminotransferase class V-fold PLP-dependent enzyme [Candidatus Dormibacteraeota bacterium]